MLKLLLLANLVYAHSGGTDAEGCHNDSSTGEPHCHDDNNSSSNSTSGGLLSSDSVWTPYIIMYSSYAIITGACYLYERKMKKQGKVLLPKNRAQSYISMLAISRK